MEYVMESFAGGSISLEDFAEKHRLTLRVRERSCAYDLPRFMADFDHVEIGGDGILRSAYGNGETPEKAISSFARLIEGRRLVYRSCSPERRDFDVPNNLIVNQSAPQQE